MFMVQRIKYIFMYLVLIGWFYVAVMMAIAEATSSEGTLLGAFFTLLLYGILPIAIIGYILGTPARRSARKKEESASEPDEEKKS
jgi:hypothetical protein